MNNIFTISSVYQWKTNQNKQNNSEKAIKHLADMVKSRFADVYNVNYRRLRASAGKTMLYSIMDRIEDSQVIIIDITTSNKNVFLEAGIALTLKRKNRNLSIYFIIERNEEKVLLNRIPSDLQGYFISEYTVDKQGKVTFKDQNSLRMSIESDVKDYFNKKKNDSFDQIDEYNFN